MRLQTERNKRVIYKKHFIYMKLFIQQISLVVIRCYLRAPLDSSKNYNWGGTETIRSDGHRSASFSKPTRVLFLSYRQPTTNIPTVNRLKAEKHGGNKYPGLQFFLLSKDVVYIIANCFQLASNMVALYGRLEDTW